MNRRDYVEPVFSFGQTVHLVEGYCTSLHGCATNRRSFIPHTFVSGDGMLNFEEYIQLMEQQKTPEEIEDNIVQAFRVFDSDNKGYVESADLRELLENMDWKISDDEVKDLINRTNLREDRRIRLEGQ